jgi:hypothetical protein
MDAIEGLFQLVVFLFRSIIFLFELLDFLQFVGAVFNFVWEMIARTVSGIPWLLRKLMPAKPLARKIRVGRPLYPRDDVA